MGEGGHLEEGGRRAKTFTCPGAWVCYVDPLRCVGAAITGWKLDLAPRAPGVCQTVQIFTHTHTFTHTCTYTHAHALAQAHTRTCTRTSAHTHALARAHTQHTHIRTHLHTHLHACVQHAQQWRHASPSEHHGRGLPLFCSTSSAT